VIRRSDRSEADSHSRVQRAASLAALEHIYGDEPYPDEAVLQRWQTFPGTVLVGERDDEIVGVAGIEEDWLYGFYVLPGWWGTGVADELHEAAVALGVSRLWCLEENRRARRFYEKHGWQLNGETRVVEYPPHPLDVGYSLERPENGEELVR
jgi:GNAT superfamily N-acetyltransferase